MMYFIHKNSGDKKRVPWLLVVIIAFGFSSCRQDMHDQPRYEPLEESMFFPDVRGSRLLLPGTVARGQLNIDEHFYQGKNNGELVSTFPISIDKETLQRGRQRYDIYCSPCHDMMGTGRGMIVERGFRPPPSFHIERLRTSPVGHFFDVITNGLGAMYDYSDRISPKDRWAIVAYIRVLQLSQNISMDELPDDVQQKLLEQ